jgi:hypothetical protein
VNAITTVRIVGAVIVAIVGTIALFRVVAHAVTTVRALGTVVTAGIETVFDAVVRTLVAELSAVGLPVTAESAKPTSGGATSGSVGIIRVYPNAIVTALVRRLDDPITAGRWLYASRRAGIRPAPDQVQIPVRAVVAFFTRLLDTISAVLEKSAILAATSRDAVSVGIAIIAGLARDGDSVATFRGAVRTRR